MQASIIENEAVTPEFLAGGGELGELIRRFDWAATPLGPFESWPKSLRTCIRIMLTSRQPIWIGWGKDLIKFYNDPYKAIVGGKHPSALGKPASVVWKDIWKDIEPMLKQVMEKDEGTYVESQLLIMERNGYPEETYYTFSYTPIPGDDGKTEGMFCANSDDTGKIISERQLKTLTILGKRLVDCKSDEEIIQRTIETLSGNPQDFPFALFRTIKDNKAVLAHSTPLGEAAHLVRPEIDLTADHPVSACLRKALDTHKPQVFDGLRTRMGDLPRGAWEIPPEKAIVLPIDQSGVKDSYGLLVIGLNPYRLLDDNFLSFFTLMADQVATSFNDVYVLKEERKRAEALAEIDRAKTIFFSNISHEFRTPLTLLLGPIEEIQQDPSTIPANKIRIDAAYRNALRMQRLVNTLLEFSRIEAGRAEGSFSRVDLCAFTQELASSFRSAIEKAGMQLHFNCGELTGEVYVDTDMWEKVVLNLLSNAFKYTKEGTIRVSVSEANGFAELRVSDTGVGIPPGELSKIFDRFHRIENLQGRSQEGTGIGLALVKELVKIHQGTITVDSQPGKGSTFTVCIPMGKAHLPAEKISSSTGSIAVSKNSVAFLEEAMKWIPVEGGVQPELTNDFHNSDPGFQNNQAPGRFKVVLADDNADMRDYVERLLAGQYQVITAGDGEEAFQKVLRYRADLLLSDIMMPRLDGFGLLKKVRQHPDTKNLPVIFLSARAGEEAKVEGLEAGADDYLVKPFSSKELLARVDANIKIAKNREAAEQNLRSVILQSPIATTLLRGPDFIIDLVNERGLELWGRSYDAVINQPILTVLPEIAEQGFDKLLAQVYNTGVAFTGKETPVELVRFGKPETVYLNFIYEPLRNEANEVSGIIGIGVDVTEQVLARKKLELSEKEWTELANAVPQLVWVAAPSGEVLYYNERVGEYSGAQQNEDGTWTWTGLLHEDDRGPSEKAWAQAVSEGVIYQIEHRVQMEDGRYRWHLSRAVPYKDESGTIIKWFGSATDIHVSKMQSALLEEEVKKRTAELYELNLSLQRSNNELQQFAHVASHDLKEPLRKIKTFTSRLTDDPGNRLTEQSSTFLQKVNSASDRMFAMIEGVLNYSVLNTSEQVIEPVSLQTVLQHIEADLELLVIQKAAILQYNNLPTIDGSFVLLYQLFYNLVNNSLKFARKEVPPVIQVSSEVVNDGSQQWTLVMVKDNGIGFAQAYAEKIFESFTRLNSKDQYEGTGLGLSLCQRIAERHGGRIEAVGMPGEGACFLVRLPLHQNRSSI